MFYVNPALSYAFTVTDAAGAVTYDTIYRPAELDASSLVTTFNVKAYEAVGDGTTTDTTAIQNAIAACASAGGGVVYFPPGTYRCMGLTIPSNVTLLGVWPVSILKLPAAAGNTSRIFANETIGSYTDSNITIDGLVCDGNNQGNGGAQARFTGLVEFGRVTGLKIKRFKVQNTGYIGIACGGIREFDIEIEAETCGFDGTTSNGGPAIYIANQSKDQSRDGVIRYFASYCRWIGGHVNGSNIEIQPRWKYVKEAGLFTAYAPSADILCQNIVVTSINGNGVTENDISGSGMEIGCRGMAIGSGVIRNCDHNAVIFTDAQDVTFAGGLQAEGYNQDTQSSSPQSLGVGIISGSASPDNARNILVTGVSLADDSSAFTVTISNATPAVITKTDHALDAGDMVQFTTTGALPTGLTASTKYFVREDGLTDDTFQVSATRGGAAINTSSAGSGTQTCTRPTTAYGKFGIGGGGTAATNVRFINHDGGRFTSVGSDIVTTKFGSGCQAKSNTGIANFPLTEPQIVTFTGSGTWTKDEGLVAVVVEVVGGGGSGGGGYSRKRILRSALGATETVTVGTGGAAPTAGLNAGNAGNSSSFGSHCSATGGTAGQAGATAGSVSVDGVVGGIGSGGDINAAGGASVPGVGHFSSAFLFGGSGGDGPWGGGGAALGNSGGAAGGAGRAYGGGGAGAVSYNSAGAFAGGAGANGVVIVTEYYE